MSVGIPDIDADHKRFICLINDFIRAIVERMGLLEIGIRLQLVLEDAERHFAQEEKLFKKWQYPHALRHANKHREVIKAVHDIMEEAKTYNFDSEWKNAELAIKDVLVSHVMDEDMKYADFFHRHPEVSGRVHRHRKTA